MQRHFIPLLALVLCLTAFASAQPLADRVPADALVYVGWSGSQNLGPAYDASHLKAIAASSDIQKLFTETFPALARRAGAGNAEAGEMLNVVSTIGGRVWRHPTAFYFGGLDMTNPRNPMPKIALFCDAGDEAAALAKDLQATIDKAGKQSVPMKVLPQGTMVTLTIGPVDPAVGGAAKPAAALATSAPFRDALAQVDANSVAAVYVNVEGLLKLTEQPGGRGPRAQQRNAEWIKAKEALGLNGLKAAIWTGSFDGKDWSSKAFVAAPAPRTGILSICEGKPLGDDMLKLVPSTAVMFMAGSLDLSKIVATVRETAGKIDPKAPAKIDQGLDQFRGMTGLDLQNDVLAPLGDQWAIYTDPNVAGAISFGATLINKPKDPAKTEQSFVQLDRAISTLASGMLGRNGMMITNRELKDGDTTIHYWATPIVRPAWTIKSGVLYIGLYPQVVSSAVAQAAAPGRKSILENESFVAMRKRLGGGANASAIRYVDLPKTAPMIYPTWLLISGYAGFADLFGAPGPAMLIPPLDDLLAHLAPAGAISWMDAKGWHSHAVSPFPGSQVLGSDPSTSVAVPALMVSILLPSLNRARETANRVKCASNERQIGQAILLYSNDNRGKYPPDLGTLLKTQDITIEVFTCPSSGNDVPAEVKAAPIDVQAAWVNANSNYVYKGAGKNNAAGAEVVILYEKNDDHDEDGMNFLYGDGHVEWQSMPMAQQEIQKAGGKPLPPGGL